MGLKQKIVHDAGITSNTKISQELNDQGGIGNNSFPRSAYAINESIDLVFTEGTKILESSQHRLNIADGGQRPGTTS